MFGVLQKVEFARISPIYYIVRVDLCVHDIFSQYFISSTCTGIGQCRFAKSTEEVAEKKREAPTRIGSSLLSCLKYSKLHCLPALKSEN